MRHTTPITIEHIVVASNQPYEKLSDALAARLGSAENWGAIGEHLLAANASEERVASLSPCRAMPSTSVSHFYSQ